MEKIVINFNLENLKIINDVIYYCLINDLILNFTYSYSKNRIVLFFANASLKEKIENSMENGLLNFEILKNINNEGKKLDLHKHNR